MANVYKRLIKGKYERWYVRYKDPAGRWKTKSCGKGVSKVEATYLANHYSAREINNHHKLQVKVVNESIENALCSFRDIIIPRDKAPSSAKREKSVINTWIKYFSLNLITQFKDVSEETIEGFKQARQDIGREPKTIREELRIITKFFKFAMERGYCFENPAILVKKPKKPQTRPRYFSHEELKKIFQTAEDPYRDIFKFLYLTGLRSGELKNLEWSDYNPERHEIIIRIKDGNKTKRECCQPLNKTARKIIEKKKAAKANTKYIFTNGISEGLDNDNIYRNLERLLKKLDISNASPHTFRHTTASHMVIKGIPIYTVSKYLRHKSVKETEVYAHLANKSLQDAADALTI